jgi:phosphohistidine phosphatase
MKILLLLRHAHAENLAPGVSDFERGLTETGKAQARELGNHLQQQQSAISLVLSSSARRARETTQLVLDSAGSSAEVRYEQTMYEASTAELLAILKETPDASDAVLMVGHNPGIEELAQSLSNRAVHMSTCTLATLKLNVDNWSEVAKNCGELESLVSPDDLR